MPNEVEVTVVRNGGKDIMLVPTPEEQAVAALLSDRAGYIRAGHLHLIPGLDSMLEEYGYEGELPAYGTETKTKRTGGQ